MDRQNKENLQKVLLRKLDTYFFDLDGTLIDSSKDIAVAANYALKNLGFQTLGESEIIKHVGYGGENLIRNILPEKDENLVEKGVKIFREYYFSNPVVFTKPFEYIPEILEILKNQNKKLVVITNKYRDISIQILEKLNMLNYFDEIIGGDTFENKKPHPQPILEGLKLVGGNEAVIIGDSEADVNTGKSANIKTALVLYGFGNKEKIKNLNPDFTFKKTKDILEALV